VKPDLELVVILTFFLRASVSGSESQPHCSCRRLKFECGMAAVLSNEAAVLLAPKELQVQAWPMPEVGPSDVLLEMKRIGICGSDCHYLREGRIGPFVVKEPMVLGHEAAGVVVACGAAVSRIKVGDRVALEPGIPCSRCEQCMQGRYNLCPGMRFHATPPVHGSLARYVAHPEEWCHVLPESVSLEEGAMCEPLSVGVHAARRGDVKPGDTVLVFGAGPIGLVCALASKAFGAAHVTMTDVRADRLAFAKAAGIADAIVHIADGGAPVDVEALTKANGGAPYQVCHECCGFTSCLTACVKAAAPAGCITLVGMGSDTVSLPLLEASIREVDIKPIFRYRHCYPTTIALLAAGKLPQVKSLVTHRFGWSQEEVVAGFAASQEAKGVTIKVMFEMP